MMKTIFFTSVCFFWLNAKLAEKNDRKKLEFRFSITKQSDEYFWADEFRFLFQNFNFEMASQINVQLFRTKKKHMITTNDNDMESF